MNYPNKVINVNLSSLLSLKAELLRKQAEVNKAKIALNTSSAKEQIYTSHTHSNKQSDDEDDTVSLKKKDKKKRCKKIENTNDVTVYEHEDSVMLEKSRRVLEAKTKFYENMQKTGGKLNTDDNCLVMFNKKKQEDKQEPIKSWETICSSSDDSTDNNDSDHPDDPDDEWVEYTDCLGRTRTCLKRDLEEAKRKDAKLAASMPERLDQTKANWMIDTMGSNVHPQQDNHDDNSEVIGPLPPTSVFGDGVSNMSKLEEQKSNWERKEQENLDKSEIHYQDVFFDEARQHGVGYYAFSTDEEERRKQQRELEKARQETLDEQKRQQSLKEQREKIIAERVLAAKNRQRARIGLPPLEKDIELQNKDSKADTIQETKEERKARKKAQKLEKKKQIEEEEREKERLNHVRPWDKEKEGVTQKSHAEIEEEWHYKPEREPMTQEQWNEYKRNERINEFAPPPPASESLFKRKNFRSAANVLPERNYNSVPPPPDNTGFSKYQSTKATKAFKRRYCGEINEGQDDEAASTSHSAGSGVCIPPPSNLEDFFLPSQNRRTKSAQELEKSIEAGLRFLRNNSDKEMPATKSSWTAKADY